MQGWRREKSLADLSQRRNDAHPLQQAQRVPGAPGFFDLSIRDAVNIYPRNGALSSIDIEENPFCLSTTDQPFLLVV